MTGGVDIAASVGTLNTAGTGLKKSGSELTQSTGKAAVGNSVTFDFTFTAPPTNGTATIYATGLSCDGNSGTSGDDWNFAPDFNVVVKAAPTDTGTQHSFSVVFPPTSLIPNQVTGGGASYLSAGAELPGSNITLTTGAAAQTVANAGALRWPVAASFSADTSLWFIEIPFCPVPNSILSVSGLSFGLQKGVSGGQNLQAGGFLSIDKRKTWASGGAFLSAGGSTVTSIANQWTTSNSVTADTLFLRIYFQTTSTSATSAPNTGLLTNLTVTGTAQPLTVTEAGKAKEAIPLGLTLGQNYPNPFNPETTIRYAIPRQMQVKLTVYDVLGHEIKTLVDGEVAPGEYSVAFNGVSLPSGVYLYILRAGTYMESKKLLLLK